MQKISSDNFSLDGLLMKKVMDYLLINNKELYNEVNDNCVYSINPKFEQTFVKDIAGNHVNIEYLRQLKEERKAFSFTIDKGNVYFRDENGKDIGNPHYIGPKNINL